MNKNQFEGEALYKKQRCEPHEVIYFEKYKVMDNDVVCVVLNYLFKMYNLNNTKRSREEIF